jgi:hypothetical protein
VLNSGHMSVNQRTLSECVGRVQYHSSIISVLIF